MQPLQTKSVLYFIVVFSFVSKNTALLIFGERLIIIIMGGRVGVGLAEFLGAYHSLYMRLVAHQAGAYPGFRSMKRLGVFLLPPGWDASPSQGNPQ